MNERIRTLLGQLNALEDELRTALHEQEATIHFRRVGRRIQFTAAARDRHRRLRTGLLRWLAGGELRNFASAPFIYGLVVPLVIFDLGITLYQATCFPLYRIAKVRRRDYIVIDRQYLGYLNFLERLHCTYCAYANGLIAYAAEIAARTEQYWCPIKHARKVLGTHSRYREFLDYGDAEGFHAGVARLRAELAAERTSGGDGAQAPGRPG
jgi:hypothetical protein